MRDNGFTLIELLVTITVVGVLAIALGFEFVGWRGKYAVETQVKEVYSDLMNARSKAMQRKRTHFVSLTDANTYTVYEDDHTVGVGKTLDGDGVFTPGTGNNADTELPSFPKTVEFDLNWNNGMPISFSPRGLANIQGTLSVFIDRDGDLEQDFSPDFGCIVISTTRINLGRWNEETDVCDQR
jgi:prepilin-type N-terminal cleavage/methylation domain-containing protein